MATKADIINHLWYRLSQVRSFRFKASNGGNSQTDWSGQGDGLVVVTSYQQGWLFTETGRYITPHNKEVMMSNRYLWQKVSQGLLLSHLRYEQPVALVELQPQPNGSWQAASPHLCGQDCYRAHLVLEPTGFALNWQINGPRKNEQVNYHYVIDTGQRLL